MVEIIAEAGKNFVTTKEEQSLEVLMEEAKKLIRAAKEAGADTIKWQAHANDEIHPDAKLISPHFDQDRYEWVKRNTYPFSFWVELKKYCEVVDIEFLATPMSKGAAILLEKLGVERWKIGSGDILDFPMLDFIRKTSKPVIISSGMSTLQELKLAYNYLAEKVKDITILHCISNYPCKLEDLNLLTIPFLKKQFPEATIGFSDHSLDISTGAMAINLGAKIIEKHFTLDRNAWGPDHKVSLIPEEFREMVQMISNEGWTKMAPHPKCMGLETKFINESEMQFRPIFRKGLYASRNISEGVILSPDDFVALRPRGNAESSENYPFFLDKMAAKTYKQFEAIK